MNQSFFGPAIVVFKHPVRPTPLTLLLSGHCEYPYGHSWSFAEGERIPTVVEKAYVERFSHERSTCPGSKWCQPDTDPIADLQALATMLRAPLKTLPDWVWIDGVAYRRTAGYPPKLERVEDETADRWFPAFAEAYREQNVVDKDWVNDTKGAMRAGFENLFGRRLEE